MRDDLPNTIMGQRGRWDVRDGSASFLGQPGPEHGYQVHASCVRGEWAVFVVSLRSRVGVTGLGATLDEAQLDAIERIDAHARLDRDVRTASRRAA